MYRSFLLSLSLLFIASLSLAQGKITWNMGMNIAVNTYSNMHPRIALDRAGNPMVVWGRMSDGAVFFTRWNGTAFTTPVKLNPSAFMAASATWMGPDIASKGDTVYVVMKRMPEASDTNHIYIMRSFNGGINFSSPLRVDFISDSLSRFPTVAVDATGNPVVAFMKFNSMFMDSRWVVTKSTNFGTTFSTDVKASGYSGSASEACDCCPAVLVTSGNKSALVYRDNLNNKRDMWTGISNNNNVSFNSGFMVDNTNWMVNSCPSSGPDAVMIGDSLYTVFLSGSGTGAYWTYLSKSSVNTGALTSVAKLTGPVTGLTQQNFPRIAADGNAAAIVWKQNVSGVTQLPILFTNNIATGFPAAFDTVDLGDITNTDVAMSNGKIFVIWQDGNSGTVKYRSGIYSTSTGITEPSPEEKFGMICYPNPANKTLKVEFTKQIQLAEIKVLSLLGEVIFVQIVANTNNAMIDIERLNTGIYFIEVSDKNNQCFIKKFIKN